MILDLEGNGFEAIWRDYQVQLLRYLFKGEALTSGIAWQRLNEDGISISRASVINSLNQFVEDKIANYTEETCKGGTRRIYTIEYTPSQFENMIIRKALYTLKRIFPDNYVNAIMEAIEDEGIAL